MRLQLSEFLKETDYLLHADMWNATNFPSKAKIINTGIGESNLLNIAGGIASQGKIVYIYGVCGFIIHRFEQLKFSCKHFGAKKGKILICNAGQFGYENLGIGHKLDDDINICESIGIKYFLPKDTKELKQILEILEKEKNGIYYIKLGRDE